MIDSDLGVAAAPTTLKNKDFLAAADVATEERVPMLPSANSTQA